MIKKQKNVYMGPKNNFIFQKLFTKPGNESILIDFLSSVLNEGITSVKFVQNEANLIGNVVNNKSFRLDIQVTLPDGRIIDVEMQRKEKQDITKRLSRYAGRIVSDQMDKDDEYDDVKDTIIICILDYNFTDLPEYHTETITVAKKHREYELANYVKYHFIELPKFRKAKPDLNKKLDQWLIFLDDRNRELINMAQAKNEEIKKAQEIVETFKANPNIKTIVRLLQEAEYEEKIALKYATNKGIEAGRAAGIAEGHAAGIAEGITKNKEETVKEMYNIGLSIEQIKKVTKLSEDEIIKIINN